MVEYWARSLFSFFSISKGLIIVLALFGATLSAKASTITVPVGGNLQAAINAAQSGDTIVLDAGGTYVGSFSLPNKSGSSYITIQSSRASEITGRVSPGQNALLAKLQSSSNAEQVIKTAPGAHHYKLVGLEISTSAASVIVYDLVRLGESSSQTSLSDVPHDLILDRLWIHGFASQDVQRGVSLNSRETSLLNSYVSDIHGLGYDTQAIAGWNGPGPFHIINNYLEAGGENILFGGSDPSIPNLVPSDIEIRGNYVFKPLSWKVSDPSFAGHHWTVKNLLELKNARNVLIDGNVFENCWTDGQTGIGILFTVRNQDGTAPWSIIQNVSFTNNVVKGVEGAINMLGSDNERSSQRSTGALISNNLFTNIRGGFLTLNGYYNVTITHNTSFQSNNTYTLYGEPSTGFTSANNLTIENPYGIYGDGGLLGTQGLNHWTPSFVFNKNLMVGASASDNPTGNFYPSQVGDVGFVDFSGGNYSLLPGSPYHNAGSDGKDIGVDFAQLSAALGGAPPSPTPTPVPTASPTPTPIVTPSPTPQPSPPALPSLWFDRDIGNTVLPGRASGVNQSFTIVSSGDDIWESSDSFHFAYQLLAGDGQIVAQVMTLQNTDPFAKAGVMIRETLTAGSRHAFMDVTRQGDVEFLQRFSPSGETTGSWGTATLPQWVKLVRNANVFTGYISSNGTAWTQISTATVAMSSNVYIGLVVTSHNNSALCTGTFENVVITSASPQPASPSSVLRAKGHADSLVTGIPLGPVYSGDPDPIQPVSPQTVSDLNALTADIELAYWDFQAERNLFDSNAGRIESQLTAAILFSRANAALAATTTPSLSIRKNLQRIASHLAITEDLMLLGSITQATADQARATNARTDVLIGAATSGYGVATPSSVAPSSLGSVLGNPSVSPLTTQTTFATPSTDGSLPYELAGVSVTVGRVSMPILYVSPNRVMFFVPANSPYGTLELLVTSQDGFVSRGAATIANSGSRIMTTADDDNGSAVVMNARKFTSTNIEVTTPENFGPDKRTRLTVFASGISGTATNSDLSNDLKINGVLRPNFAESVRVEARRSDSRIVQLPVEFAGKQGTIPGMDQINVVLPPELRGAGTVQLTLIVGGLRSNAPSILIR